MPGSSDTDSLVPGPQRVEWLNYHHLLYFWTVAKEGSVARASRRLRLAHPTISGQIRRLEEVLGEKLFDRSGRRLELTNQGRLAFRYADDIFALGRELLDSLKGRATCKPAQLVVGVGDLIPPSLVQRIIAPALAQDATLHIVCREERSRERLMADLALSAVDVVLSSTALDGTTPPRLTSHAIGGCGSILLGATSLASALGPRFPESLDGAPFLLPSRTTAHRRDFDDWLAARQVRPRVVAELDDLALAAELGHAGLGLFFAPDTVAAELVARYRLGIVGTMPELRQQTFAICAERQIRHPAIAAICAPLDAAF